MTHIKTTTPRPFGFDRFPYLSRPVGPTQIEICLLPPALADTRAIEVAGEMSRGVREEVYVSLATGRTLRCIQGFAAFCPHVPDPGGTAILSTASRFHRTEDFVARERAFLAWHLFDRGSEAVGAVEARLPSELIQFILVARAESARNALLAPPADVNDLLATLTWYRGLREAWLGGWIWKPWRAWLVEIAMSAHLFPRNVSSKIGRVHSAEAAVPGATPEFFGQALARAFPDLFAHLDHAALSHAAQQVPNASVA